MVMALTCGMLVFTGAYGVYRDAQSGGATGETPASGKRRLFELFDKGASRFDSVDFFTWILGTIPSSRNEFTYGRSALDLIAQPIPRFLMPNKPSQTSAYLMETLLPDYDRSFTPEFGLVAELYVNGWIVGVVCGGLAFGPMLATCEHYVHMHRRADSVMLLYAGSITTPMGRLLAGWNSFATIMFIFNLLLGIAFLSAAKRRGNPSADGAASGSF